MTADQTLETTARSPDSESRLDTTARSPDGESRLDLGYSFCPNDTFIFYALAHGKVPAPLPVREVLEDVETLNLWARGGRLPITKISYRAYFGVMDQYVALRSGGALGRGVGPLVVTRDKLDSLDGKVVASPGALTTAELLLRSFAPGARVVRMRYDEVMPAVQSGQVDAGLIIHESRFTYQNFGLHKFVDLGRAWEQETNLPLPLGAILVRRDLGRATKLALQDAVRASLEYAWAHPAEPEAYIRRHALEMEGAVMRAHIDLYVNDFSRDVGEEGERAARELQRRAIRAGVVQDSGLPLFVE